MIFHIFESVVQAQPLKMPDQGERKTCGGRLSERIGKICEARGGYRTTRIHQRSRRGIYNDCCQSTCSDESLYDYCNDSDVRPRSAPTLESENLLGNLEQNTENVIEKTTTSTLPPQVIATVEQHKKTRRDFDFGTVAPEYNIRPMIRIRKSS